MSIQHIFLSMLLTIGYFGSTYTMDTEKMKRLILLKEFAIAHLNSDEATKSLKLKEVKNTRRFIRLENVRQKQKQEGLDQSYIISLQLPLSQQLIGLKESVQSTQPHKSTARTDGYEFEAAFKKNLTKKK